MLLLSRWTFKGEKMQLNDATLLGVMHQLCTSYRRTLLQSMALLLLLSSYVVLQLYRRAEFQKHVITRHELVSTSVNNLVQLPHSMNDSVLHAAKSARVKKAQKKIKRKVISLFQVHHGGLRAQATAAEGQSCFNKYCVVNFLDTSADIEANLRHADAILFQGGRVPKYPPARRDPKQVFVFLSAESPLHLTFSLSFTRNQWRNRFNWTMTYRHDSDIPYPYGRIVPRGRPKDKYKNYKAVFARKIKKVAWLVSDCPTQSKRRDYVHKLQKYIPVDVYGGCGRFQNCSKTDSNCLPTIERDYMFYLSFENSICTDYVTEKVFNWFERDIVTVVRGGMTYDKILPNGTYIDTADFTTIQSLGAFLNKLSHDEESYTNYLKAKAKYRVEQGKVQYNKAYCNLCSRLQQPDKYRKSYNNVAPWWYYKKCIPNPKDIV